MNSYFTPKVLDAIREILASEKNARSINQQVRDAIRASLIQEYSKEDCSDDGTDLEVEEDQ